MLGRAKMLKTRSTIKRAVVGSPLIADIQILDIDEEEPKIIAVYGKNYGSTSLTIWDAEDAPITFLLRVSIDTRDLERRIPPGGAGRQCPDLADRATNHSRRTGPRRRSRCWRLASLCWLILAWPTPARAEAMAV